MEHWVQYHNVDDRGPYIHGHFTIVTDKSVAATKSMRVWLISGQGTPRRYFLEETFEVDTVRRSRKDRKLNEVCGSSGVSFKPAVEIGSEAWFPQLRSAMGNFAFGFQHIKDPKIIRSLEGKILRTKAFAVSSV